MARRTYKKHVNDIRDLVMAKWLAGVPYLQIASELGMAKNTAKDWCDKLNEGIDIKITTN